MTIDECITCERLLLRAKQLIDEALWAHIYAPSDEMARNCAYSQWLNDCDRFLTEDTP